MSDLSFRNRNNEPIQFGVWEALKRQDNPLITELIYGDKKVYVNRRYFGTIGSVFKVYIECSSDITKFHGYIKHYEGEDDSLNDYNRLISSIQDDEEIFDKTLENGLFSIYYDSRFDQHIVIDLSNNSEVDYCFPTRSEAELKYNELIGN